MTSPATLDAIRTDGELLQRIQTRDPLAREALYDRHSGTVMAIALRVLGCRDEAGEVVQDVFWKLWRTHLRYDPARGRFTSWLRVTARNRAIDLLRSRNARPGPTDREPVEASASDPESETRAAEERGWIRAALAELPSEQREVLELAYYGGRTHREIAAELGQPLGTVKSRIGRAVVTLRRSLAAQGVTA